jgi:hypothetical protein
MNVSPCNWSSYIHKAKRIAFIFFCFLFQYFQLLAQPLWIPLGPTYNPGLGIGHLECIAFDPGYNGVSNKTMYVGSPTGGLWKSKDGGESWNNTDCSTDKLPFIGVADIAINPKNAKQIYIATGTRYKRKHVYPLGIYRSNDAGKTWQNISDGIFLDPQKMNCIARVLIDPSNVKILYAATSLGIFKTSNAGKKWIQILAGDYHGLELNPKNSKIIYVAGTRSNYNEDLVVLRSSNAGKTWIPVADTKSVFNDKENMVIDLAISPSAPNIIYVMIANKDGLSDNDLYISTNEGKTWRRKNIPYPNDHRDKVSIGVSPVNPGEIYIGKAWDFYKSKNITDSLFNKRSGYEQWESLAIGHADVHDFAFAPVTHQLFVAQDGGLWNESSKKDASNGLNISTINVFGTSETKSGFVITGHQDCGANIYDSSLPVEQQWRNVLGGDGREGIIDYTNDKNILSASMNLGKAGVYGPNMRSTDGGKTFYGISLPQDPNLNALNAGPMVEDPKDHNVFYFGYTQLYKGTFINEADNELKWERLTNIPDMMPYSVLSDISVNQSNNKCIYAGFVGGRIFKTTVGGEGKECSNNCWLEISPFKNLFYFNFVKIVSVPDDPNRIWAAFTGTFMSVEHADSVTNGINKIMYSDKGGKEWTPFAQGLPETPVYSIVYVKGSASLLFAATEMGVYYRNASMTEWKPFNMNLPNVIVSELEVNYHEKKLYAATYGRGLWAIDISNYLK